MQVPAVSIVTFNAETEQTEGVPEVRVTGSVEFAIGAGDMANGVVPKERSAMGPKVMAWLAF